MHSLRLPSIRRLSRPVAMLALAALAGCTGTSFGNRTPAQAPIATNQPVTGEVLGNGSVRVAMLLPLSATGNAGQIATNLRNAAELALRESGGADIQILVKDDRGTADGARAAASEAISQGAELVLGPVFSQSVAAAAAVTKPAGVPMVAFSTDTSAASSGVYLLSFLPQQDVERVITYAASQGKRSIAALLPENGYGTVAEAALQQAVARTGGRVVAIERYALDRVSMQSRAEALAEAIKGGIADAIFIPDAGDAAPFLAQILAAKGVRGGQIQFLGSGQWNSDQRILGESTLSGAWYPAPDQAAFQSFAARYSAAYGATPIRNASLGYDAAILAAGLTANFGGSRFSSSTITNASGFKGMDGAFRFLSNGTNQRALAIYKVERGSSRIVDPAPSGFGGSAGF